MAIGILVFDVELSTCGRWKSRGADRLPRTVSPLEVLSVHFVSKMAY